jgi:protein-disulfide isomerase
MEPISQNDDNISFTIKKTYLYVALALLVGFGSGLGVAKVFLGGAPAAPSSTNFTLSEQSEAPLSNPSSTLTELNAADRPYLGPEDAPVTVVEFTDYQCPFCGQHFRETLPRLLSEYESEIKYVVFNYPLSSIHPRAQKAAEAAECAYDQGKFWEYRALLFQNQQDLDVESLKKYARDIGLNAETFTTCVESGDKEQQVLRDYGVGKNQGVNGTPTFFINGKKLSGAQPIDAFKALIDATLLK